MKRTFKNFISIGSVVIAALFLSPSLQAAKKEPAPALVPLREFKTKDGSKPYRFGNSQDQLIVDLKRKPDGTIVITNQHTKQKTEIRPSQ